MRTKRKAKNKVESLLEIGLICDSCGFMFQGKNKGNYKELQGLFDFLKKSRLRQVPGTACPQCGGEGKLIEMRLTHIYRKEGK